jgi:hypothetical protein
VAAPRGGDVRCVDHRCIDHTSLAFIPLFRVRRAESPDRALEAVARTAPVALLFRLCPDSPGTIPVGSRWMIADLRWNLAGKPREASLVAVAKWDLDACSVEVYGGWT